MKESHYMENVLLDLTETSKVSHEENRNDLFVYPAVLVQLAL